MSDSSFWSALDAAVPEWRDQPFPSLFAALDRGREAPRRERVDELVVSTLGKVFAPQPSLEEALDQQIDAATARAVIESILHRTLAYDSDWVEPAHAKHVASTFVARFADDADFWTNGELWQRDGESRSWSPLTLATFDTGVAAVDGDAAGILWVTDED